MIIILTWDFMAFLFPPFSFAETLIIVKASLVKEFLSQLLQDLQHVYWPWPGVSCRSYVNSFRPYLIDLIPVASKGKNVMHPISLKHLGLAM